MKLDIIRRCRLKPYRKGMGPTFSLIMWDTDKTYQCGKSVLGYQLNMHTVPGIGPCVRLFDGEDFHNTPGHAMDSNHALVELMGFLTLRPGDTDTEFFANYTPAQLDYCNQHAEALGYEVNRRFCDENGRVIESGGA